MLRNKTSGYFMMLSVIVMTLLFVGSPVMGQPPNQNESQNQIGENDLSGDGEPESNIQNTRVDNLAWVAIVSIIVTGFTIAVGSIGPAIGEGRAVSTALSSIAQQPDASNTITRTLFVGLAMIESTAIYCFVVSMILLFANPFWNFFIK